MKNLLLISLILLTQWAVAQVVMDKTMHDFGEVRKEDPKFVDFKLTNASSEAISILRHDLPYGVSVRFSSKLIAPDESIVVRIKYTPKRKGTYSADVNIWVSSNNEPLTLSIKGKAMTFDVKESLESPEITSVHESTNHVMDFRVKVVDEKNREPIENAHVDIIWDGLMYKSLKTNLQGESKQELKEDIYYLLAWADGYGQYEGDYYFEKGSDQLVIALPAPGTTEIADTPTPPVKDDPLVVVVDPPPPPPDVEPSIDTMPPPPPVDTTPEPEEVKFPDFPENQFAPNNIVFLIDVSVSMKHKGKMNLLKASMIELTNLLRDIDKVAIVTYSSKAELALASTPASNKEEIVEVIRQLEAKGSTSGSKGVKKAYQVLNENKIQGGNNQVFISTDGAFNLDKQDKSMLGTVKKNAKKGYKISVIGIKNEKWTVKNMKKIAEEGDGHYLHIKTYEDARTILVEEIKAQSLQKN